MLIQIHRQDQKLEISNNFRRWILRANISFDKPIIWRRFVPFMCTTYISIFKLISCMYPKTKQKTETNTQNTRLNFYLLVQEVSSSSRIVFTQQSGSFTMQISKEKKTLHIHVNNYMLSLENNLISAVNWWENKLLATLLTYRRSRANLL